jgi:TrpR-related protein YerC/YecD
MTKSNQSSKLIPLNQAILSLKSIEETKRFLRDLLTEEELNELKKRWQAAQMLDQGVSYVEIENFTGLSSTTVARVSKWLKNGKDGYRLVLDRFNSK